MSTAQTCRTAATDAAVTRLLWLRPRTRAELAESLGLTAGTIDSSTRRLIASGHVVAEGGNGRPNVLRVAAKGEQDSTRRNERASRLMPALRGLPVGARVMACMLDQAGVRA